MIEFKTTPEKRLSKWSPILDALKVSDKLKRQFMSDYAEYHTYFETKEWQISQKEKKDIMRNILLIDRNFLVIQMLDKICYQCL